jgi:hypothetical protein
VVEVAVVERVMEKAVVAVQVALEPEPDCQ